MSRMIKLDVTVAELKTLEKILTRLPQEYQNPANKEDLEASVPQEVVALAREVQERVTASSKRVAKAQKNINRLQAETREILARLEARF
jgi:hypothetical protein